MQDVINQARENRLGFGEIENQERPDISEQYENRRKQKVAQNHARQERVVLSSQQVKHQNCNWNYEYM